MAADKDAASVDMAIYDSAFTGAELAKLRSLESTVLELLVKRIPTTERPLWMVCKDPKGRRWARLATPSRPGGIMDIPCEHLLSIAADKFRESMEKWIDFPDPKRRCCEPTKGKEKSALEKALDNDLSKPSGKVTPIIEGKAK